MPWPRSSAGSGRTSTGAGASIEGRNIVVVAPYNLQVGAIESEARTRGIDAWVGTVDKFQGQEGAVASTR